MSKRRIVLGIVFLVLFIYFATNLINILYRHHAFGISEKETKAENGPNDNPPKPVHHSKAYDQGYQMGCTDDEDQTHFIASGGLAHHTKQFVKGYNDAFTHGPCPSM